MLLQYPSFCLVPIISLQLVFIHQCNSQQQSSAPLMNLISPRDISELTQFATDFAAQAMKSNGKMIAHSGPEVRPIPTDARPSEIFGQGLTNMLQPARQLASLTLGATPEKDVPTKQLGAAQRGGTKSNNMAESKTLLDLANTFLGNKQNQLVDDFGKMNGKTDGSGGNGGGDMIGQALRMLNGNSQVQEPSAGGKGIPNLRQLLPGANRNFGIRQGEGCLPFLGEFMKMAYGNCVNQADEKTWDAWGNEISNALTGGKIDLLKASKQTCKMGAEREQCGQLRRAISECDILGSITLATNLQRSVARCDEITGLMDQNPGTMLNQMNGLINGEVAQGLLNNFLGR